MTAGSCHSQSISPLPSSFHNVYLTSPVMIFAHFRFEYFLFLISNPIYLFQDCMLKNIAPDTKGPLAPHHHLALLFGYNETFSPAWPDHLPQGTCTCPAPSYHSSCSACCQPFLSAGLRHAPCWCSSTSTDSNSSCVTKL